MQIKPLRTMVGNYGRVHRGVVATVPDNVGQQLVKRGIAVPVQIEAKRGAEAAKPASVRPSENAPSGGPTGEAKRPSSSVEGQARKTNRSKE